MEYGLIPKVNQYADNNLIQIQQVQPLTEIANLKNGDDARQVTEDKFLKGVDETSATKTSEVQETKKIKPQDVAQYQEVVLTNMNFGFNDSSKDFFVRAIRGEAQNQFPTDEMMKLKAYFIAQAKAEAAAEL